MKRGNYHVSTSLRSAATSLRRRNKPAYLLPKPTRQARVRINGKDVYLGAFQTPESLDRYEEVVRQWLLANCPANESGITLTIDELAILYLDYSEQYKLVWEH